MHLDAPGAAALDQRSMRDPAWSAVGLVARAIPSVVEVRSGAGYGAGFVWQASGLLVTADHVVPHKRVGVRFADGRTFQGHVVARDTANDLAVLSVPACGPTALESRAAETLRPGEIVLALGHPFGASYSPSLGIVAAGGAGMTGIGRRLIRVDVRIGPGNSGGPLLDARGRVVGINVLVGGGMGLAVPSELAECLVQAVLDRRAA